MYCEKTTTISLVNISYHIYLSNIFLVIRTLKIYSLYNFEICNTGLLTIVTMLYEEGLKKNPPNGIIFWRVGPL